MITLDGLPRNGEQFIRLTAFLKEILKVCQALNVEPMAEGSLAVFAYTKDPDSVVNDIDLAVSEQEFPRIVDALAANRIRCRLREWHVLQATRDDLRVELDAAQYWHKDLLIACNTLQIDEYVVRILSLDSLREVYRRGLEFTAGHIDEGNNRRKNQAYVAKLAALNAVAGARPSECS